MNQNHKIYKVIYFDEYSAGDYLNIFNGGVKEESKKESNETESYWERNSSVSIKLTGSITMVLGAMGLLSLNQTIIQVLSGIVTIFGGVVSVTPFVVDLLQKKKEIEKKFVTTQITSNVLTQFLDSSMEQDTKILKVVDHKVQFPENSFTYIKNISPVIDFIKKDDIESFPFEISKLGKLADDLKGYYSAFAINKSGERKVLRFNSKALRNNYRLSDLLIMDIVFYAVKVGELIDSDNVLSVENEFKSQTVKEDNVIESKMLGEVEQVINKCDLYDVILAGVGKET